MSPKSLVLIGGAVLVLAAGVYLFIQVKATPAQAHSPGTQATAARGSREPERTHEPPKPAAAPSATPVARPPTPAVDRGVHVGNATVAPEVMAAEVEDERRANPRFDSMMELANKAYDRQDFDEAIAIAGKVLSKDPTNVRMLRVMVSANCIAGDSVVAQQHYEKLPKFDRDQMKARCDRYGVSFRDPPQ